MSDLLLATAVEIGSDTMSKLGVGLVVTVIGMGVVFGVLLLLYGLMVLIGRFGGPAVARDQSAGLAAAPAALAESDASDAPVRDEELVMTGATAVGAPRRALVVAAVAAVLAAAMESETSAPPVRHGRQAGPRRPQMDWALAGRMELVTARERLQRGSRVVRGARS